MQLLYVSSFLLVKNNYIPKNFYIVLSNQLSEPPKIYLKICFYVIIIYLFFAAVKFYIDIYIGK